MSDSNPSPNPIGTCRQCGADNCIESPSKHGEVWYDALVRCSCCRRPDLEHKENLTKARAAELRAEREAKKAAELAKARAARVAKQTPSMAAPVIEQAAPARRK